MAKTKRRLRWRAIVTIPFAEAAASAVLGVIIIFIDPESPSGFVTFAIGVVLSLSRLAFTQLLDKKLAPVRRMCALIDINRRSPNSSFLHMINLYTQVLEPEFQRIKDAAIDDTIDHLRELSINRRSKELGTGAYYSWLFSMLEKQAEGEIWAISTLNPLEWTESATEMKFVQFNKDAAARGTSLTRVFVIERHLAESLASHPSIDWHFKTQNVTAYIVIRDEVLATDPQLLSSIGDGFIAFDTRVAMIDVFADPGSARGYVTTNPQDIQTLRRRFNELVKAYGVHHSTLDAG